MKPGRQNRLLIRNRVDANRQRHHQRLAYRWAVTVLSLGAVVLVAGLVYLFIVGRGGRSDMANPNWSPDKAPPPPAAAQIAASASEGEGRNELTIRLSDLPVNKVRHFTYGPTKGDVIRFFVVRRGLDEVVAALDTCRGCYFARAGFFQDGDYIVCRNCVYSAGINELGGPDHECRPVPIPLQLDQDSLTI